MPSQRRSRRHCLNLYMFFKLIVVKGSNTCLLISMIDLAICYRGILDLEKILPRRFIGPFTKHDERVLVTHVNLLTTAFLHSHRLNT